MSDLDWDDEDFAPTALGANKDNWDDEEEEVVVPKKIPSSKNKKKQPAEEAYKDETLDDPIAEKLRRQKLVEEADLKQAKELFGSEDFSDFDLETFVPKNAKDFEKLATACVKKLFWEHRTARHYKLGVKTFVKVACGEFSGSDVKEIEQFIAQIRNERIKKEKELQQKLKKEEENEKKKGKKFINTGGTKGDAGLDDYKYDYHDVDDDYDFM